MRSFIAITLVIISVLASASAEKIVITVGGNTTNNASTVFQPAEVKANIGDVIFFNFTQGNHSATQSTFAGPCIPAHISNVTINGFDSGLRNTDNGTTITNLQVQIVNNDTIWFYDVSTCAEGGVGGININDSSTATLAGFRRNAIRLNGTATSTSAALSGTSTSASGPASASATGTKDGSSGAERAAVLGFGVAVSAVLPMMLAALLL